MKLKITALTLAVISSAVAFAQKQVDGLTYFLPKTAVRMSVLVEKTSFTPGELAAYSDLYFKTPASKKADVNYRIVDINFTTEGQPDADHKYTVAIDKKHSILSIDCDRNGVLTAINDKAPAIKQPQRFVPARKVAPLNPRDFMSQDILAAGNLPKMAQLVAQEIYDIRDSRNQLSRGEADNMPKDGEQLRIMFANLDRMERALMQMFTGVTVRDTVEHIITFVPEKEKREFTAFRFSRKFGITTADDYSGAPYKLTVTDENIMPELPAEANAAKKEKDDFQLGICLPGKISMTLTHDGNEVVSFSTFAAQFGRVEMLNGALFGKKMTSHLIIDPITGSVVKLRTEPLE